MWRTTVRWAVAITVPLWLGGVVTTALVVPAVAAGSSPRCSSTHAAVDRGASRIFPATSRVPGMVAGDDRTVSETATRPVTAPTRAYTAVIGLAGVVVLLQALWAGVFIREHQDYPHVWIVVHARGADVAIGLGVVALVVLLLRVRHRRDLVIGTAAFVVALVVEAYIGGLVGPNPNLSLVHFPLAMAIMGLAVWLPFRAVRARS